MSRTTVPNTYGELHYHFVWSTKDHRATIIAEIEADLYGYIRGKCAELGVRVHALNGIEDHSHLVCAVPPSIAISHALHRIKGASSHFANQLTGGEGTFWQPGFGAFTVSKRDLARVVAYVVNQKEHHRNGTLWAALERTGDDEAGTLPGG